VNAPIEPEPKLILEAPTLQCFRLEGVEFDITPASPLREWMDAFPTRHPYRCLPLAIANTHGWHIHLPCDIAVTWNGGPHTTDLVVSTTSGWSVGHIAHIANSNFSMGIFTFHTGHIFRTSPGWNLLVTGPMNLPKRGCHPLSGVIESYWLPYPFTMNYQMERPGSIYFEAGEPIAQIMPIPANYLPMIQPEILNVQSDPELYEDFKAWRDDRMQFLQRMDAGDAEATRTGWQRRYFTGVYPGGEVQSDHVNKLRLQAPLDLTEKDGDGNQD
jgi:Family of unknown function (DUF6065)